MKTSKELRYFYGIDEFFMLAENGFERFNKRSFQGEEMLPLRENEFFASCHFQILYQKTPV